MNKTMVEHFVLDPNRYNNGKNAMKRPFDICIVDEASQCVEPESLLPLKLGFKKMIMVGDPEQLPATVTSMTAKNNRYDTSMFSRLFKFLEDVSATKIMEAKKAKDDGKSKKPESSVQKLLFQYRMHSEIVKWPNSYFYGNTLKNGTISRISSFKPYAVRSTFIFFKLPGHLKVIFV